MSIPSPPALIGGIVRGNVEFGLKMKGKARYSREPAARGAG